MRRLYSTSLHCDQSHSLPQVCLWSFVFMLLIAIVLSLPAIRSLADLNVAFTS
jgi:hypothetical protein